MKTALRLWLAVIFSGAVALPAQPEPEPGKGPEKYVVKAGTRLPLVLVNSVSTKTSEVGDRVYLQTSFPVSINSRIVIPEGSYVTGTITQVKRPGRLKGRGEIYLRFDTLMLRNGIERDLRGTVSASDGSQETLTEKEGTIQAEPTKGQDAGTVASSTASGAAIGAIAGEGKGAAIGAGVGAAAGMIAVLLTRGSEVRLLRGTGLEMQLDRDLAFTADEINFLGSAPPAPLPSPPPQQSGATPRGSSLPFPIPRPF
ncbi:MAG: hypothetical protein HY647_13075 [Acidobacteria bacterium]|nr:hypothetical protein [Acidobacteriota bacterium]